jgi:hypothetical protein
LEFDIWDRDTFDESDFIGEFGVSLKDLDLEYENDQWYRIPCFEKTNASFITFPRIHLKLVFYYGEVSKNHTQDWSTQVHTD